MAVTDYDTDYLYLFRKTGSQPIPLGNFYKLVAARGCWKLHYLDAQHKKQHLQVVLLHTDWSWHNDNASIQSFIDAVQQHNPSVDVRHGWFQ